MIYTTEEYKTLFRITAEDDRVDLAISESVAHFYNFFGSVEQRIRHRNDLRQEFKFVNLFPMSKQFDKTLQTSDFEIFQQNQATVDRIDITSGFTVNFVELVNENVLVFNFEEGVLVPGYVLVVKFRASRVNFIREDISILIRKIFSLDIFNRLLVNNSIELNQTGIKTFNLNGVVIDVDSDNIQKVIDHNDRIIKKVYDESLFHIIISKVRNNPRGFLGQRIL